MVVDIIVVIQDIIADPGGMAIGVGGVREDGGGGTVIIGDKTGLYLVDK
jgi:hypothetical protein